MRSLTVTLGCLLTLTACAPSSYFGRWNDSNRIALLSEGMTELRVAGLLGRGYSVQNHGGYTTWTYTRTAGGRKRTLELTFIEGRLRKWGQSLPK